MKPDCSSPQTLSAPAPKTMILNRKRTLIQIFPITVEWDWTLSSKDDKNPQSPIVAFAVKQWSAEKDKKIHVFRISADSSPVLPCSLTLYPLVIKTVTMFF